MAQFTKRGDFQWRARIRRKGQPEISKTFDTRKDAEAWARAYEREMDRGSFIPTSAAESTFLKDAFARYEQEVLPRLSSKGKPDKSRLNRLSSCLGHLSLIALDSSHVAKYRDDRVREGASAQTIKHEMGLLNRVLKACQIDWNIPLPRGLATALVRKPSLPQGRERRLNPDETQKLLEAAAQYGGQISLVIRFALETAMRRSEIKAMRWEHVDLANRVLSIPETKTGIPRRVPLSTGALEVLRSLPRQITGEVWSLERDSMTQAFSRVCRKAGIEGLRLHDLRHEATSRFFEKGLEMMQVATITGHKTLSMLKRYTHLRAEDLAYKLG